MREEVLDFRSQAFHAGFHVQFLASVNFFKSDPRKAFFFFFFFYRGFATRVFGRKPKTCRPAADEAPRRTQEKKLWYPG